MASTYDIGDLVKLTGTFTDTGGNVADPTTVNFAYTTPASTTPSTYTRTSTSTGNVGGIWRVSTGVYYHEVSATGQGLYRGRFTSTGQITASGESWFSVRPRAVST